MAGWRSGSYSFLLPAALLMALSVAPAPTRSRAAELGVTQLSVRLAIEPGLINGINALLSKGGGILIDCHIAPDEIGIIKR